MSAKTPSRLPIALTVSVGVLVVLMLAHVVAAGQTAAHGPQTPVAKSRTTPRMPDGHPDLSGVWTDRTATPLERDPALGTREFFTDAEFADLSARQRRGEDLRAPRGGNAAGAGAGNPVYDNTVYGDVRSGDPLAKTKRTSLIIGPEGRVPPMLPEAVKRNADRAAAIKGHEFDSYEYRNLEERCIVAFPAMSPPMIPNRNDNTHFQTIQGPGYFVIYQEELHDTRVIPTDGRPHIAQNLRSFQGDSVGHWEGDTLVIDTTNFRADRADPGRVLFRGTSDRLHTIERLTRTSPDTIIYQFTVDDPGTWAKPWTAEFPWNETTGPYEQQLYEYACHEGNHAILGLLGGARAQEAEVAKTKK